MDILQHLNPVDPNSSTIMSAYYSSKPEYFNGFKKFKSDTGKFKDVINSPDIRWKPEYEKNPKDFLIKLQRLSDYMLFNDASMFGKHNPNSHSLLNIANRSGQDHDEYKTAQYLYGEKDPIPYNDFNFFYSAKSRCVGEVATRPFQFNVKTINTEFTKKMRKKANDLTAEMLMNLVAEYATREQGIDLSFLIDPNFTSNIELNEALQRLNPLQRVEYIVDKLIKDTHYKYNLKELARKCYSDKFDVNAEFAFIDVDDTYDVPEVIPRYLSPDQVRFITTRPDRKIETLDDPSVIAASVIDYININQIVAKYGRQYLTTGTGIKALTEAVNSITNGKDWGQYDPNHPYFVEYYNSRGFRSDDCHPLMEETGKYYGEYDTMTKVDYMKNIFYPGSMVGSDFTFSTMEQKMFFKVLKEKRYIGEIDGKPANKAQIDKWRNNNDNNFAKRIICTFKELGDDEKTPQGYHPVVNLKEELWSAVRLGHGALLDIGPYKWHQPKEGQRNRINIPIASRISYDKSFAALGDDFRHTVSVAWNRVKSITYFIGRSSAVVLDNSLGMNMASALYNAKVMGLFVVDSNKAKGGGDNILSNKILSQVPLGNEIQDALNILSYINMLLDMYQSMIGISKAVQGAASPYESSQNLNANLTNQSIMRAGSEFEHDMFLKEVYQKSADLRKNIVSKYIKPGEEYNVLLTDGEVETLKIIEELPLAEVNIHIYNGFEARRKAEKLEALAQQAVSAGGVNFSAVAEIIYTDNSMEHMAIIKRAEEALNKRTEEEQKIRIAEIEQRAKTDQMKAQIPVQVQEMKSQTDLQLQEMQSADRDVRDYEKGEREYYKAEQKFKEKLLDADIRAAENDNDVQVQQQLALQEQAIKELYKLMGVKQGDVNNQN